MKWDALISKRQVQVACLGWAIITIIDSTCGTDTTPAAAAGGACEPREAMPFDEWASVQRRRAALDGAWKVEVSERVVHGRTIRSVTSWHGNAKQLSTPLRRTQQSRASSPARSEEQVSRSRRPQRLTARQRCSALRSATHHRSMRLRVLRSHLLAVRFLVRLSRLSAATRALHDGPSPGKRRLSPSPDEQQDLLLHTTLGYSDDASEQPEVAHSGWVRRVLSRVGFGDG